MLSKILFLVGIFVVASEAETAKSECELHRERESLSGAPLPMRLIPECEANGDYRALQCFQESHFCVCWDKEGNALTPPSTKTRACECLMQKHEADTNPMPGKFRPQCEEDGKFKKHQCSGSSGYCWCAHPETGRNTTEPARGAQNCD